MNKKHRGRANIFGKEFFELPMYVVIPAMLLMVAMIVFMAITTSLALGWAFEVSAWVAGAIYFFLVTRLDFVGGGSHGLLPQKIQTLLGLAGSCVTIYWVVSISAWNIFLVVFLTVAILYGMFYTIKRELGLYKGLE